MAEVKKIAGGKIIDLSGKVFSRWTVVDMARNSKGKIVWNCECSCGTKNVVLPSSLVSGKSKSCGCLKKEVTSMHFTTHGMSTSIEYRHYANMLSRCTNKNHPDYEHYTSRGIGVCQEFIDDFLNFYNEIGNKPDGKWSVGRIDNTKSYERGNIRWETDHQQARNHSLQSNNKTGIVGVLLRDVPGQGYRAIARYNDENGKRVSKSFSVAKYGVEQALQLSKEWRELKLKLMLPLGVIYGEFHGMPDIQLKEVYD